MEKAIATALMIIASVVAVLAIINAVMPAVGRGNSALASSNIQAADRIRTSLEIVYVSGDSAGLTVVAWIKNTGSTVVKPVSSSDVIIQTPSTIQRLPYGSGSGKWVYVLEDSATDWGPTNTAKITLTLTSMPAGVYTLSFIAPNGIKVSEIFSVA